MRQLIVFVALLSALPAAHAREPAPTVYARVEAAAIEILVGGHLEGSGVIVEPAGFALTAAHAVEGATGDIEVRTSRGRVRARRVALDLGHDLALIALDPAPNGEPWPMVPVAAKAPPAGAPIVLYGAPIYRHAIMLRGMVARPTPAFEYLGNLRRYHRTIYVSGVSPPGTSGGPWLNADGHVIGIQSGVMNNQSVPVGIAYAAPHDAIRALVKRRTDVATPTLGVAIEELWEQPVDYIAQYPKGTEGLRITYLFEPAASAGLQINDLIVKVDAAATPLRDDLLRHVRSRRVGQAVTVLVQRGGEQVRVPVTLAALQPNR